MSKKSHKKVKKTKSRAKPKTKKTSLKKLIKTEIARMAEDKTAQSYQSDLTLYSAKTATLFDSNNIIPLSSFAALIAQGTGQGDRIGNQIRIKKLQFRGTMVPLPQSTDNDNPVPMQVKMTIMSLKANPTTAPTPNASANIFQLGDSVSAFTGTLVDMWAPYNTDIYSIYAQKVFKLGYQINNGAGALDAPQFYANNDFKLNCNFNFDLTKHIPHIMRWSDAGPVTSRQLWCMVEPVWADGTVMPTGVIPLGIQYMLNVRYEDS